MQKVFLDTNIILDFLGEREKFYDPAAKLITMADKKLIKIFTSSISYSNAYYLLCKYENKKSALEKIRKFKLLCNVSITNDEVVEKSINSDFTDFEDALQYFSALATGCRLIITRNEKDFKNAMIPVMNAESYLQTLKTK